MGIRRTSIGWADYSGGDLNIVIRGRNCPVSEGCAHCYVKRWFHTYRKGRMPENTTIYPAKLNRLATVKFDPGDIPYRRGPESKPIMFVADFGDLFHDDVPLAFQFNTLSTLYPRNDADWVLLTKRPKHMLTAVRTWLQAFSLDRLPDHIWCMVTAENQRRANERIPVLLEIPAVIHGVSIEPMLESIELKASWLYYNCATPSKQDWNGLDWVIVGAESGKDRRPFNKSGARHIRADCKAANISFFYKQSSGLKPGTDPYLDGKLIQEFPL